MTILILLLQMHVIFRLDLGHMLPSMGIYRWAYTDVLGTPLFRFLYNQKKRKQRRNFKNKDAVVYFVKISQITQLV